jgi:hypothetical protein
MNHFHRDLNSGINILRVFHYSLEHRNHDVRHAVYCKTIAEERSMRKKISKSLRQESDSSSSEDDDDDKMEDDDFNGVVEELMY